MHYFNELKASFFVGIVLFFFTIPCSLYAQIRVGPKVGAQVVRAVFADPDYREQFTSEYRPGFQLGGVMNYRVTPVFSLHTELFYNLKGKKSSSLSIIGDQVSNTAYYHYLDLPVLLRLSKHKNLQRQKLEYYFNAGPNIQYWLGGSGKLYSPEMYEFYDKAEASYKITFKDTEGRNVEELYVEGANRIQMSLDFGCGIIFDLGTGQSIMIDVRNSLGIGKTYMGKKDGGDFGLYNYRDNFESVNHVLSISGAWLIDIDMEALMKKGRIRR